MDEVYRYVNEILQPLSLIEENNHPAKDKCPKLTGPDRIRFDRFDKNFAAGCANEGEALPLKAAMLLIQNLYDRDLEQDLSGFEVDEPP